MSQYMGGKTYAIARYGMRDFWRSYLKTRRPRRFVDRMTGLGNVAACVGELARELGLDLEIHANDAHPAVICMLRELAAGRWDPPEVLSEDDYKALQARVKASSAECPACQDDQHRWHKQVFDSHTHTCAAAHDPMVGFAGFLVSFGGKYFAGYGGRSRPSYREPVAGAAKALRSVRAALAHVTFHTGDYRSLVRRLGGVRLGDTWYDDKPYKGTQQYRGVPGNGCTCCGKGKGAPVFCENVYWANVRELAGSATRLDMLISEFSAPDPWATLWSTTRRQEMRDGQNGTGQTPKVDRVFALPDVAEAINRGEPLLPRGLR